MNAIHELALNQELADAATVSVESGMLSHSESHVNSKGKESNSLRESFDVKIDIKRDRK